MVTTLFRHPNIRTLAPGAVPVTAIAVEDGVIRALGDYRELAEQAPGGTATVELPGTAVLPGFHDAHIHAGNLAREREALDLRGADSLETAQQRIVAYATAHPDAEWIFGGRWDSNAWRVPIQPTRADLDAACPDRPAALPSVDGHTIWANSRALAAVGIDRHTPDPVGGVIVRDEHGEPSGIFREAATAVFDTLRHSPLSGNLDEQLARTQQHLLSLGLTSITDIDGEDVRDALLRLHDQQLLQIRVNKAIPLTHLDAAIAAGRYTGQGDDLLSCGPVKIFSDGALGSHTAHMSEDFAGEPGNRGIEIVPGDVLRETVRRATAAGIAVATHAIGDRANHLILNVYAELSAETAARGLRHRVEHAQHLLPGDVARFAELGVVASLQPTHCTSDIPLSTSLLAGRTLANYAWRSLLNTGAIVAFGSDAPVEDPNPFFGVHAAVTRQTPDGHPAGGWEPEERLSVTEALRAYTEAPARAAGREDRLGRIAPGQLADLIAVDVDPVTIDPAKLRGVRVLQTIVGGVSRYEAAGSGSPLP